LSIKRLNEPNVKALAKPPERAVGGIGGHAAPILNEAVDRILRAATKLFAERGYDAVSTREIAAAVGLNVATVNYHVGSKRELYQAIFKRIDELQTEIFLREATALHLDVEFTRPHLIEFVERMVDALVGLALEFPEGPLLRARYWLDLVAGVAPSRDSYSSGLVAAVEAAVERAKRAGIIDATLDLRMLTRAFNWMMVGYFIGAPQPGEPRFDPLDPAELTAFRAYLRRDALGMLGLLP